MAINGRDYDSQVSNSTISKNGFDVANKNGVYGLNLGKVFGIMFLWLLATALIAFGGGYLFANWMGSLESPNPDAVATLYTTMIISGISLLVLTFVIQFVALRKGKGMLILSSLYVLCMGLLCCSFTLFIDWRILGIAFGITTVIFGILSLIGFLAKNVRPIAFVGIMLVVGASITALITWIVTLFLPSTFNIGLLWILDFAIFGGMLLLIIVDLNQINRICKNGEMSTNLTLYCALTLYSDFVYIFIKIVYYLLILYARNK